MQWHAARCGPLDSLSGVSGNCLECIRLFVGGTYGGGVIAARMKTLLVACTPKRCLPWTIRSPARLIGAPLSASSCESSANRQWATTSPRPRQAAEVPLGMSSA